MSRSTKTRRPIFSIPQMLIIVGILISMVMVLGLNSSSSAGGLQSPNESSLTTRVAQEQERNNQLVVTLTYVNSDNFVEDYARNEAGMVLSGEKRVVPLFESLPVTITPEPLFLSAQSDPASPKDAWWMLFFDSPPPGL